jgi:hypothetical protein
LLPLASAAVTKVGAGRFDSIGRLLDEFHHLCLGKVLFLFCDHDPGGVAGDGALNKDHKPFHPGHAPASVGHPVNGKFDDIAFAHSLPFPFRSGA